MDEKDLSELASSFTHFAAKALQYMNWPVYIAAVYIFVGLYWHLVDKSESVFTLSCPAMSMIYCRAATL